MADPVSIARAAWSIGRGLWSFVDGNLTVNNDIRLLHGEAEALGRNSEALERLLGSPDLVYFQTPELWDEAFKALDSCKKPLEELQKMVNKLQASKTKSWTPSDAIRVLKKSFKDDHINKLREQLRSHNVELLGIQVRLNIMLTSKNLELSSKTWRAVERLEMTMKSSLAQGNTLPPRDESLLKAIEDLRTEVRTKSSLAHGNTLPLKDENLLKAVDELRTEVRMKSSLEQGNTPPPKDENLPKTRIMSNTIPARPRSSGAQSSNVTTSLDCSLKNGKMVEAYPQAWARAKQKALSRQESWAKWLKIAVEDVPAAFRDSYTELHWAVIAGYLSEVKYFLNRGHSIDEIGPGTKYNCRETPLHCAIRHCGTKEKKVEIACWLIDHRASVAAKSSKGATPLHAASVNGVNDVVASLIFHKADIEAKDKNGDTPLYRACRWAELEVVESLISAGAKVNTANNEGWSPLHAAARDNYSEVVTYLIGKGAKTGAMDMNGRTPLHGAASRDASNSGKVLLAHKANTEARDNDRRTALHITAYTGACNSLKILLASNADTEARDKWNDTPLHTACWFGKLEAARLLLEHGVKADQDAVEYAAKRNHLDIVQLLFDYRVRVTDAIKSASTKEIKEKIEQAAAEYFDVRRSGSSGLADYEWCR